MQQAPSSLGPGQLAVVTGAGSGIGRAIALSLGRLGVRLILVGRTAATLNHTAAAIGPLAAVVPADLTTDDGVSAVLNRLPPAGLDVLAHSAGLYARGPCEDQGARALRALYDINVIAPMRLTSACLPFLRAKQGQVVFINSSAGVASGAVGLSAYAGSKHALRAAADSLRQEVNLLGVRVLSVFPGRTNTPMQARILVDEGRSGDPDSLIQPEDIASVVLTALSLPKTVEVTDIHMRPTRPLRS